jgi:hypothetical protein
MTADECMAIFAKLAETKDNSEIANKNNDLYIGLRK